jgi:hypothetical protein
MSGRLSSLSTLLQHSRMKRISISADGNSFYRAISEAYYKDQSFHLLLRKTVVEDILYNISHYQHYFPSFPTSESELIASRQKGVWNSSLERLLAFGVSQQLNIRLVIYTIQDDETLQKQVFSGKQPSQTIRLLENKQNYTLLLKD